MTSMIRRLFGAPDKGDDPRRLRLPASAEVCYAIGDVHGCLPLLTRMEERIAADAATLEGSKWIVLIGDVIDRGEHSAQVIDHLLAPPPEGFERYCIAGNHEQGMIDFLDNGNRKTWWLEHGGIETLISYGIDPGAALGGRRSATELRNLVQSHIPREHEDWLRGLPLMIETPDWIFVHAGLEPGVSLARQSEETLLWYRDDFSASFAEWGKLVVHGHTPLERVFSSPHRMDIDTGAVLSGRLSAVRLRPGEAPELLEVAGPPPLR